MDFYAVFFFLKNRQFCMRKKLFMMKGLFHVLSEMITLLFEKLPKMKF